MVLFNNAVFLRENKIVYDIWITLFNKNRYFDF